MSALIYSFRARFPIPQLRSGSIRREHMKAFSIIAVTISLSFSVYGQAARPRYTLTDLGAIGPVGQVLNIAANGLVAGAVQQPDNTLHAVLFYGRQTLDISRPGIGGKNSLTYG